MFFMSKLRVCISSKNTRGEYMSTDLITYDVDLVLFPGFSLWGAVFPFVIHKHFVGDTSPLTKTYEVYPWTYAH